MVRCSVPKCNLGGGFKFPSDPDLQKKWIIAIKRLDNNNPSKLWTPNKSANVCKAHFKEEDLIWTSMTGKIFFM